MGKLLSIQPVKGPSYVQLDESGTMAQRCTVFFTHGRNLEIICLNFSPACKLPIYTSSYECNKVVSIFQSFCRRCRFVFMFFIAFGRLDVLFLSQEYNYFVFSFELNLDLYVSLLVLWSACFFHIDMSV